MILFELRRAFAPRRLLIVVVVAIASTAVLAGQAIAPIGVATNVWDVVVDAASFATTVLILLLGTAVLTSELWFDRERPGVESLTAVRVGATTRWLSKLLAAVACGAAVGLILLVVTMLVALVVGQSWASDWSAWGAASYDPLGTLIEQRRPYSRPLPLPPFMALPVVYAVQGALAGLLVGAVAAVCARSGRPPGVLAGALALGLVAQPIGFSVLNPAIHVVWVTHLPAPDGRLPWTSSGVFLGGVLLVTVALGAHAHRRLPWSG